MKVGKAKGKNGQRKEKNKSFELCVTINNSIKGHMTLKNSEKRGENKEKWEKFWGIVDFGIVRFRAFGRF